MPYSSASVSFILPLASIAFDHGPHAVGTEQAHEIVFQRDEELRGAGVALAARAAAQLVIDAAGFVPLGADDVQAAQLR